MVDIVGSTQVSIRTETFPPGIVRTYSILKLFEEFEKIESKLEHQYTKNTLRYFLEVYPYAQFKIRAKGRFAISIPGDMTSTKVLDNILTESTSKST